MQLRHNQGFTLIEVAISIGILSFGLTAILLVYLTSLRWAEEVRIDLTGLHSARGALYNASHLTDAKGVPLGCKNTDVVAEGWVNDYYVVRASQKKAMPVEMNSLGEYYEVRVQLYYGGNQDDGRLVQELGTDILVPAGYAP